MVVRLIPARRATSSSATRRNPCCSNSTTAAPRMASAVWSAPGIARLSERVVAQAHWQTIPHPVDRSRAPQGGETLVATLLTLAPRQAEHVPGPRRHTAGGEERGDGVEHGCDHPPHDRRDTLGARKAFGDIADAVLGGLVWHHDLVDHAVPVALELVVVRGHRAVADAVAAIPRLGLEVDLLLVLAGQPLDDRVGEVEHLIDEGRVGPEVRVGIERVVAAGPILTGHIALDVAVEVADPGDRK